MCASTLLSFHQLYIVCQSTNARFVQSLDGDAYEHHVTKNQVTGDTSELLELQSSFSREIDHEIMLNMHGAKESYNEAGSEIAANAAVRVLERIGSAENINLVEDAVIPEKSNGTTAAKSKETAKRDSSTMTEIKDELKAKPAKKPKAMNGETKVKDTRKISPAKLKDKPQPVKKPQLPTNCIEKKLDIQKENVPQKKKKKDVEDSAKKKVTTIEPPKETIQNGTQNDKDTEKKYVMH